MTIRYNEADVRPMGRSAGGVRGMKLKNTQDAVVSLDVARDDVAILILTDAGYGKRTPVDAFRAQKRGGRGVRGADMKEDDLVSVLLTCSTHDFLLFFTNRGKVYRLKVYELPEGSRTARGKALINVLPLRDGERVMAVIPTRDFSEGKYLAFATAKGLVFMDSPGYDPCSITGQVASGANLICFTTGRGSAYGCAPSPSLKLSTNTAIPNALNGQSRLLRCQSTISGSGTR